MKTRSPLIIDPSTEVLSAVIWMHGLGADAHDFESIVPLLPVEDCGIRMVFPNAPVRAVTLNMGMRMPAWYDIADVTLRNSDKKGINESLNSITALIDEQIEKGIKPENIVVAGFSQGGAMALHAGLRYPQKLAGILALSCYLLETNEHNQQKSISNQSTSILMAHGRHDQVVSYDMGKLSASFLIEQGHPVDFVTYSMEHEVIMPEISTISDWLRTVLER